MSSHNEHKNEVCGVPSFSNAQQIIGHESKLKHTSANFETYIEGNHGKEMRNVRLF